MVNSFICSQELLYITYLVFFKEGIIPLLLKLKS